MRAAPGLCVAVACVSLTACGEDPSAASSAPEGGRTSVAGRAMDRAEDLKKEVDAYNRAIEDTIAQGTGDAPPSAAKPPASRPVRKPAPGSQPPSQPAGSP